MSTFKKATGVSIKDSFDAFNANNPEVYIMFEAKALLAAKMGKKKISSKLILNVIRWEAFITTEDETSNYKINDAFTAHYARLFADNHPSHKEIFNYRDLRS